MKKFSTLRELNSEDYRPTTMQQLTKQAMRNFQFPGFQTGKLFDKTAV